MAKTYGAVAVGAGPGGSTCGGVLAKWGLNVLLLGQECPDRWKGREPVQRRLSL